MWPIGKLLTTELAPWRSLETMISSFVREVGAKAQVGADCFKFNIF